MAAKDSQTDQKCIARWIENFADEPDQSFNIAEFISAECISKESFSSHLIKESQVVDAIKKKSLEKATQKVSNQRPSFIDTANEIANSPVDQNCIPYQGDRGRVIVFIDGSNLFYAASQLSIEIDYVKLLHYLTVGDCLVHVFFYTGYDPNNEKQSGFLHWMRHNGFRVVAKAVIQAPNGAKKANLDVEIAVDMMRLAQHCDTAVLVSGDGDFAYVLNAIAGQGVRVEVVGLRSMTSTSLIDVANCYIDLAVIQKNVQA